MGVYFGIDSVANLGTCLKDYNVCRRRWSQATHKSGTCGTLLPVGDIILSFFGVNWYSHSTPQFIHTSNSA